MKFSPGVFFFVRQITDATGSVLMAQTFDPYGNLYARDGDQLGTFGFAGEQTDASGLIYLRARYYNPSTGRFLTMDPSRQELNPYWYAFGNPIMYVDPSGLTSFCMESCTTNDDLTGGDSGDAVEDAQTYTTDVTNGVQEWHEPDDVHIGVGTPNGSLTPGYQPNDPDPQEVLVGGLGAAAVSSQIEPIVPGPGDIIAGCIIIGAVITVIVMAALEESSSSNSRMHGGSVEYSPISVTREEAFGATDPQLRGWVEELYPEGAQVGTGSAQDALREEAESGAPVGGSWHAQKVRDIERRLQRWLDAKTRGFVYNPEDMDADILSDIELAEQLLRDMKDALEEWENSDHNPENQNN